MKKIFAISVMMMLFASLVFAAGGSVSPTTSPTVTATMPTEMGMVVSKPELKSYVKERAVEAVAQGWSSGVNEPGGQPWVTVTAHDPDIRVLTSLLQKQSVSYYAGNAKDQQYWEANVFDDGRYVLFTGENPFYLDANGNPPADSLNITMKMVDAPPIYVPGVNNAYAMVYVNGGGSPQYVWIQADGDRIFFPTSLCGFTGQLVLTVGQNTAAFDLTTGANVPPIEISGAIQASIDGLITLDDPDSVSFESGTKGKAAIPEMEENPLFQCKFSAVKNVALSATAPNGEVATKVYVREIGVNSPDPDVINIPTGTAVNYNFGIGVYDVWFEFPSWGQDQPSIPPYNGGGGMG